jgi:hypothetical protein
LEFVLNQDQRWRIALRSIVQQACQHCFTFQTLVLIRLDVIRLLRATKNLLNVSRVIRLNEQIKRSQATRDRRQHCPSTFI